MKKEKVVFIEIHLKQGWRLGLWRLMQWGNWASLEWGHPE
jgi:hypothetical protein